MGNCLFLAGKMGFRVLGFTGIIKNDIKWNDYQWHNSTMVKVLVKNRSSPPPPVPNILQIVFLTTETWCYVPIWHI